jgi:GntR family transcriptional regulator of vanillate catabolism
VAQEQHRSLVDAIENRQGSRAEMLAREHARLSLSTLRTAAGSKAAFEKVPGFRLVQGSNP